jgi:sulfate/thiosulfate transport system ATP-binding protein
MAARAPDGSRMSIQATKIRKTFGQTVVLDNVDLNVPRGKLVALLGPSGSGKTTLLRIIAGLEHADPGSGQILFHGEDVTNVPAGRRKVGFVFQHYALFRHMTVYENIAFGLNIRRRRERPKVAEIKDRVHKLLQLVQLDGLNDRYPSQLSGGQRQRVALARALAVEPRVLLLDEPFGALDAKVRKDLRRWLRQFHDEVHLTTVFVTHDQEEALEIADEVVIMNQARVEQVGTPQEVYDRPASPFVYQFLGNVNVLKAQALAETGAHPLHPAAVEEEGLVYVRPHDIELLPHAAGVPGLTAVVRYIHAAGPQARVMLEQVRSRDHVEVEISRAELQSTGLKVGDLANLRLRTAHSFNEDYAI